MKKYLNYFLFAALLTFGSAATAETSLKSFESIYVIQTPQDVISFFPKSIEEMEENFELAKSYALTKIEQIIATAPEDRTFENTIQEFDKTNVFFSAQCNLVATIQMVHPDQAIRDKAEELWFEYANFATDVFNANPRIVQAYNEYLSSNWVIDSLNEERSYYLAEIISQSIVSETKMENETLVRLNLLMKEIDSLSMRFNTNIAQDNSTLSVSKEQLTGLDDDFIQSLDRDADSYILRCDYPTRNQVMLFCDSEATRRDYYHVFSSRAYPDNLAILSQLINCRDELAKLSGFNSYAEMDIKPTMAESPERVEKFLDEIQQEVSERAEQEIIQLFKELPETVTLTADGKIKPWDVSYISEQYIHKHLNIDSQFIADHFPLDQTIQAVLSVYGQFLSLNFTIIPCQDLWDSSVQMIEVRKLEDSQAPVGYLLIDLLPRPNSSKYSHACCISLIPPVSINGGETYQPALALIITNFTEPGESKPSLLKHEEVETFFHEFGHALHALLGHAEMPSKAAFNTKIDFVETPSQLLEEWVWDPEILKRISGHYLTGEPLSDELIQLMIEARKFGEARHTLRQSLLAQISLFFFLEGQNKDLLQIEKDLNERFTKHIAQDPDNHFLCSFSHLVGYGAKYYSYLWSKVLAVKIFDYIKSHGGPLDPILGQRYIEKVIGKGGSRDPNQLVIDFLNDEPSKN